MSMVRNNSGLFSYFTSCGPSTQPLFGGVIDMRCQHIHSIDYFVGTEQTFPQQLGHCMVRSN